MVGLSSVPGYFPQWAREFLMDLHGSRSRLIAHFDRHEDDEWRRRRDSERRLMYQRQQGALERLACQDFEVKRAVLSLIIEFERPWKLAYFIYTSIVTHADYKGIHSSMRRSQELLAKAEVLSRQLDEVMSEIAECALSCERYGESAPYTVGRIRQLDRIERIKQAFENASEGERALFFKARQVSNKTTYLRMFAYRLTRSHDAREFCRRWGFRYRDAPIVLTPTVYRAMAYVANVVLDDPEISVSYDDTRKAIDADMLARLHSDEDAARLDRWLRRNASD